jgi:hypothetical protein
MRKYKITILVPHERIIEAEDLKAANAEATRITQINNTDDRAPKAILHSLVEQKDAVVLDFGPSPAA